MVNNPLIVALDVPSAEDAVRLARRLSSHVFGFKVGLGLLHGPGPGLVGTLARLGPVFADAKLHDIPTQTRNAARRLGEYGARWVTAHASGGKAMLEATVEGLSGGAAGAQAGVLAVTVLTSIDAATSGSVFGRTPGEATSRLARLAAEAGVEGAICSPRELRVVGDVAPTLIRVCPGIRLPGSPPDDQRRTATPAEAIARGAHFLVVGRPITGASDPVAAAQEIMESLQDL